MMRIAATSLLLFLFCLTRPAFAQQPTVSSAAAQLSAQWPGFYPRLTRLKDGSLLGSLTAMRDAVHHLRTVHSSDNGASWSDLGEIANGTGDLDNTHIVQLAQTAPGASVPRVLAAFRNHSQESVGYVYRITVARSDDGGATWVYHSEVENSQAPNGLWEPFLLNAPDGSLQVYYARELAADDQDIVMRRSTDGGLTWSARSIVAGANIISRDGMPGVAAYRTGGAWQLQTVFESTTGQGFQIMGVSSNDAGNTWWSRAAIHTPPSGHNCGAPQVARVGNALMVVYMSDESLQTVQWPEQATINAQTGIIGINGGVTWSTPTTLTSAPAYWPGVYGRDNASALCVYSQTTALALPVDLF